MNFYFYFYFLGKWGVKSFQRLEKVDVRMLCFQVTTNEDWFVSSYQPFSFNNCSPLLIKIVNTWFYSRFLPGVFKVPLSSFSDNDIALREDNTLIYGVMLPVKQLSLKSKISKLLKFAISTKRNNDNSVRRKSFTMASIKAINWGKIIKNIWNVYPWMVGFLQIYYHPRWGPSSCLDTPVLHHR